MPLFCVTKFTYVEKSHRNMQHFPLGCYVKLKLDGIDVGQRWSWARSLLESSLTSEYATWLTGVLSCPAVRIPCAGFAFWYHFIRLMFCALGRSEQRAGKVIVSPLLSFDRTGETRSTWTKQNHPPFTLTNVVWRQAILLSTEFQYARKLPAGNSLPHPKAAESYSLCISQVCVWSCLALGLGIESLILRMSS